MTMMPDSGSPAELERRAEIEPVSALAEYRRSLHQRLLGGVSVAEVMTALTEFVDGLIIGHGLGRAVTHTDVKGISKLIKDEKGLPVYGNVKVPEQLKLAPARPTLKSSALSRR